MHDIYVTLENRRVKTSDYGVSNISGSFLLRLRGEVIGRFCVGTTKQVPSVPIIRCRAEFPLSPVVIFKSTLRIPFQSIKMENCTTAGGQPPSAEQRTSPEKPFSGCCDLTHRKQWTHKKTWKQGPMLWWFSIFKQGEASLKMERSFLCNLLKWCLRS